MPKTSRNFKFNCDKISRITGSIYANTSRNTESNCVIVKKIFPIMPIVNKFWIHSWVGYQEYLNSYIIWLCKDVQISEVSHFHIRTAPCWVKLAGLCPQEADRQRQTSNHQKNMRRSKKANVQTLDWSSLLLVAARRLYLRRCAFVFLFGIF